MSVKILKFFVFIALLNFVACTPESDFFTPDNTEETEEVDTNTENSDFKTAVLDAVNAYRLSGCKCGNTQMPPVQALKWNNLLEEAANRHTNDMADNNHFAHRGTDDSSSSERVTDTGYNWRSVGENIAFGYPDIQSVIDAWIESEGHCKNLMNETFTEMGLAEKRTFWTQSLARPQ